VIELVTMQELYTSPKQSMSGASSSGIAPGINVFNLLKTERNLLYIRT
jgi:hypothetical protein